MTNVKSIVFGCSFSLVFTTGHW